MTLLSAEMEQTEFAGWLERVARTGEVVFFCREGKPVARLEGLREGKHRLEVDPVLSQVEVTGPLCGDDCGDWEALG